MYNSDLNCMNAANNTSITILYIYFLLNSGFYCNKTREKKNFDMLSFMLTLGRACQMK